MKTEAKHFRAMPQTWPTNAPVAEQVDAQDSESCGQHHASSSLAGGTKKQKRDGPVAQSGERLVRNEEVAGSIPVGSTIDV